MKDMVILAPLAPAQIPRVALPLEACVYCWYVLHPTQSYPEAWSSTCCAEHSSWIEAQAVARRARHQIRQQKG